MSHPTRIASLFSNDARRYSAVPPSASRASSRPRAPSRSFSTASHAIALAGHPAPRYRPPFPLQSDTKWLVRVKLKDSVPPPRRASPPTAPLRGSYLSQISPSVPSLHAAASHRPIT
ncbi:hypothetical protein CALCODRAFT_94432 [Calocera cornea HHB12733]|uniref:Uncharacterized protein n=1 Tax=Calocera cornea HHB12733 TaxID=1353952 RepID=A0A165D827_9BASI|nr:hypothetical protein CALCODRAFT_94432 [Calocera cornea HHB12733]